MLKLFSVALLASTFGLSTVDAAQACGMRCCVPQSCAAPSCVAPNCQAPMAPAAHGDHAVPMSPAAAPQASAGTYRSFSHEPAMPMQFRQASPARQWVPGWMLPKSDSRKFNGGGWQ